MFETVSPEAAGISSGNLLKFLRLLESCDASTHGLLMMKGDAVFAEYYWAPFTREFCHRMYSQTKSFVSVAIGLLEQDGKLRLDDRAADFFPDKIDGEIHPWLRRQTIREMLTMTTVGSCESWFTAGDPDRVHLYFNRSEVRRPSGTVWEYDSAGSQVLSALAERLSGMPLLEFLRRRLFDEMGTFRTAEMLKTPNGDTWGDSAMLCTLRDVASFARLVMNRGRWNGRQLAPEAYLRTATSAVVDNRLAAVRRGFRHGYGYQIWKTEDDGFAFVGMGDQLTIGLPSKDLIFTITSDNQGDETKRELIVNGFFRLIADDASAKPLPENPSARARLEETASRLTLRALNGRPDSPLRPLIDGKRFHCAPNRMGMEWFSLSFPTPQTGVLRYRNAQGDAELPFGINHNEFGLFPQRGYSDGVGGVSGSADFRYRDAVSACWLQDNLFCLNVQIVDRYFGNCTAFFAFRDDTVCCSFSKTAEDFLDEFQGDFQARRED